MRKPQSRALYLLARVRPFIGYPQVTRAVKTAVFLLIGICLFMGAATTDASKTMTSKQKVWFITGAARGLGLAIANRVLAEGDILVATARNPEQFADLCHRHDGSLTVERLDVTDEAEATRVVHGVIDRLGRIDVLVNNAGYGTFSPFEQTNSGSFRAEIDANFFGTTNVIRAALPSMRQRRNGLIINVSSSAARAGAPGMAAYCAAKAAVSVFTESLAKEVKPFGVSVVAVEPGSIRTDWTRQAIAGSEPLLSDYEQSVGGLLRYARSYAGSEPGDPARYAKIIVDLAAHRDPPEHLLLGPAAIQMVENAENDRRTRATEWATVATSTDF